VMLVVDRSGSMNEVDADGSRKWPTLVAVLRDLLPRVEGNVALGLLLFPVAIGEGGAEAACTSAPAVETPTAFGNARAVLAGLDPVMPAGGTPTHAAIAAASAYFDRAPDPLGRRYVLLATDGAPNCNPTLDPATCRCAGAATMCDPMTNSFAPINCLDDTRTVSSINLFRQQDVFTYVVGLNGIEAFSSVLDQMAEAGGRARAATPRFYPASTANDLARELTSITSGIVDCRFRLDAVPPDPTLVDLRLDGMSLIHDTGRRNGWDYSEGTFQEIRFYGQTCDQVSAATGGSSLIAAFGCPAPVPP